MTDSDSKLKTGDLVLCKVGNYPSWPAVVFPQRFLSREVYKKRKSNKVAVCFFNDTSYYWDQPNKLTPLTKPQIKSYLKKRKNNGSKDDIYYAYKMAYEFESLHDFVVATCESEGREYDVEDIDHIESGEDPFLGKVALKKNKRKQTSHPGEFESKKMKKLNSASSVGSNNSDTVSAADNFVPSFKEEETHYDLEGKEIDQNKTAKDNKLEMGSRIKEDSPEKKDEEMGKEKKDAVNGNHSVKDNDIDCGSSTDTITPGNDSVSHPDKKNTTTSNNNEKERFELSDVNNGDRDNNSSCDASITINGKKPKSNYTKRKRLDRNRRVEACLLFRRRIQKNLIQRNEPPKQQDLDESEEYLRIMYVQSLYDNECEDKSEKFFDTVALKASKLDKLLRAIINDSKLGKFHDICKSLLLEWSDTIQEVKKQKLLENHSGNGNNSDGNITTSISINSPPLSSSSSSSLQTDNNNNNNNKGD
ncbi:uncharacterized protein SCODWIG_03043 [Saccharomycodes ludwigii]|uniref:PWWP domain-containing protein n=1 Tax=Saccharomycodes ludwigii TaxID=36035 RepID=A0A376B9F8_9ASCO|nr:hypothetical protein SCDLUD_000032 [Saccharomycodes ludwigii]KAH3902455.1 hypothetical protein SCDLUD_000032 [Saccharomycodes ludwigii]SSD61282.1 uncharacterized protein SCODWIG_03043 [Saccharomycodes ludwigii]